MAMQNSLQRLFNSLLKSLQGSSLQGSSLQGFDLEQLTDTRNLGLWPLPVKLVLWIIAFLSGLGAGHFLYVTGLQQGLEDVQAAEKQLREEYRVQHRQAAHLEVYQSRQQDMEQSFEAILKQLPAGTEIPGLIEDMTRAGLNNGLVFSSLELQPEIVRDFYIEQPVAMIVTGGYHELAAFVSSVANLSRIVTLHEFTIQPAAGRPGNRHLTMRILARTYRSRYRSQSVNTAVVLPVPGEYR